MNAPLPKDLKGLTAHTIVFDAFEPTPNLMVKLRPHHLSKDQEPLDMLIQQETPNETLKRKYGAIEVLECLENTDMTDGGKQVTLQEYQSWLSQNEWPQEYREFHNGEGPYLLKLFHGADGFAVSKVPVGEGLRLLGDQAIFKIYKWKKGAVK